MRQVLNEATTDGQGLNPLLRHFGMVFHPPMLYLGFVGFVIPFAFAFAALATGQLGSGWLKATRAWALVAWLFLSLGLLLGGWWAYDVLGWGGYWGWDPVENCGAAALADRHGVSAQLHCAGKTRDAQILEHAADHLHLSAGHPGDVRHAQRRGQQRARLRGIRGRPSDVRLPRHWRCSASIVLLAWRQERGDLRGDG